MDNRLDIIILDDEPVVADLVGRIVSRFHDPKRVAVFSDHLQAQAHCLRPEQGLAIFLVDYYLGPVTGLEFLRSIQERFPAAAQDTVMITGVANEQVVEQCLSAGVHHLLEKPVKPYTMQFAVRAIASKYTQFAPRLMGDPGLAAQVRDLKNT